MAQVATAASLVKTSLNSDTLQAGDQALKEGQTKQAIQLYCQFLLTPSDDETVLREKESLLMRVAKLYQQYKRESFNSYRDAEGLAGFIRSLGPMWAAFPRAKAAKLVRSLLEEVFDRIEGPSALQIQIDLIKELVEWCERDKRAFLKQHLQTRLGHLLLATKQYTEALALVNQLLGELKRLDDRLALIEVHLLESRLHQAIRNAAKSRAALTAARSTANSMYCPPLLQAQLDQQSGLLHAEEGDFKTAFSYFIEALDAFGQANADPRGLVTLKHMMLCKIMLGAIDDLEAVIGGKLAQRYTPGQEVEAMRAVGEAYRTRSLAAFEKALKAYPVEIGSDEVISHHLNDLYHTLLQQNLLRLIKPYSRVDLAHLATQIGIAVGDVEAKLSQMILDGKLSAILDQQDGCLVVLEEEPSNPFYQQAMQVFKHLEAAVDSLYLKATKVKEVEGKDAPKEIKDSVTEVVKEK